MGMRIATNLSSLAAQRQLNATSSNQRDSMERLASGSRINKAADDAAGLAISERMKGQIRSVRQDVRNANDGISMIQTAEGGMNEIGNILVRFRELSIQGASDTLGDVERSFIDKEVQGLKGEINRIAASTEFNGKKLLGASGEDVEIQVGVHNEPDQDRFKFDTRKTNVTLEALGLHELSTLTKESSRHNLEMVDNAMTSLVSNRAELGALQNRLASTVNTLSVYDENLTAAKSRIRDTDMASETAELTKNNILSQACIAVLSQANQNNMLALKLLG